MKKILLMPLSKYVILFLLLTACNTPQILTLSETETQGVTAAGEFFGSSVTWNRTYSVNTGTGNSRVFKLTIDSLTDDVSRFKEHPIMLASNAAILFYKNLTDTEKQNITEVHTVLPFETDGMDLYTFRVGLLDTIVTKLPLIEKMIAYVESKNYEEILTILKIEPNTAAHKKYLSDAKDDAAIIGDIQSYIPLGFGFFQREDEPIYCRFYALLKGTKQNTQFSLDFPLDPLDESVLGLRFSYKF